MQKVYSGYYSIRLGLAVWIFFAGTALSAQAQRFDALEKNTGPVDAQLLALQSQYEVFSGPTSSFASNNPLLHFYDSYVLVDAVADGDTDVLLADLKRLGMQSASVYGAYVSGRMPISALRDTNTLKSLKSARPAAAQAQIGLTTSQGVKAMGADIVGNLGFDGSGVWVGVLSDTFDDWDAAALGGPPLTDAAADIANGDLPPNVLILDDSAGPGIDEGRAMMQIVYDVAPGANLSFHTAFGGFADFALGIEELAGCPLGSAPGCVPSPRPAHVVVDDVIYFAEAMFQDDIIAQAVDNVFKSGRTLFSSAGNNARQAYESKYRNSGVPGLFGGIRHDFAPDAGVDDLQTVTIPVNGEVIFSFQWAEPFFSICGSTCCPGGSQSDLDIILYDMAGTALAGGVSTNIGSDARELFGFTNDGTIDVDGIPGPDTKFQIGLELFAGPAPKFMKFVYFGDMTITEYDTFSGTVYGHANARGAEAVGAAFYRDTPPFGTTPPVIESFSSAGETFELFDPLTCTLRRKRRKKPEIVAPDGVNTTFFFPFSANPEGDPFPNFFGTSAAAPHAAGVAALINEAAPGIHPKKVYRLLEKTAIDMDDPFTPGFDVGFDFGTGYGLINAYRAVCKLVRCPAATASVGDATPGLSFGIQGELPGAFALDQNYPRSATRRRAGSLSPPKKSGGWGFWAGFGFWRHSGRS